MSKKTKKDAAFYLKAELLRVQAKAGSEAKKARKLIHMLGIALETMEMKYTRGVDLASRPSKLFTRIALHEYHHFAYGNLDFGSDVLETMRTLAKIRNRMGL